MDFFGILFWVLYIVGLVAVLARNRSELGVILVVLIGLLGAAAIGVPK